MTAAAGAHALIAAPAAAAPRLLLQRYAHGPRWRLLQLLDLTEPGLG